MQALLRSASVKDGPEVTELTKARERNSRELCQLDGTQRKLLNKCYSFDNKVTGWCSQAGHR